jgi:hypothetical protein
MVIGRRTPPRPHWSGHPGGDVISRRSVALAAFNSTLEALLSVNRGEVDSLAQQDLPGRWAVRT